jgi:hypothetical protein
MGPSASVSNSGAIDRCVSSVISTVPGSAAVSIRDARFTASPIAVYSTRRSEPTSPTTTSPVWIPTRTVRPEIARSSSSRAAYSPAPSRISNAARQARSASSSWAMGAPKKARIPSPISRALLLYGSPINQLRTALNAELGLWRRCSSTPRAEQRQPRPTIHTELRAFRVLPVATRTPHLSPRHSSPSRPLQSEGLRGPGPQPHPSLLPAPGDSKPRKQMLSRRRPTWRS